MDVNRILKEAFDKQEGRTPNLGSFQLENWKTFSGFGLPDTKHEEWKYTKIKNVFSDQMLIADQLSNTGISDIKKWLIPGLEEANIIVFVNGWFQPNLSTLKDGSELLSVKALEQAAGDEDAEFVSTHLGHSQAYHADGINALNAAFAAGGAFIRVKKGKTLSQPILIVSINDSSNGFRFAQPRILVHIEAGAQATLAENYINQGGGQSLTNEVIEVCVERDAVFHYIKLQDEGNNANHSGTTHIRQVGKSLTHAVTITLSGGIVRNNLNMIMEAEHGESHMYGLYLLNGDTLADNHTIVDNAMPNCYSNELYKGIMDERATGVFNGKIFVRKDAQKTNAYQSNKNILIGNTATANTKPQLEIFADDVKCSHGCTIGKLDEDSLFYLRARGISEENAKAMLLHAFAADILEQIKLEPLKHYAASLIAARLSFSI